MVSNLLHGLAFLLAILVFGLILSLPWCGNRRAEKVQLRMALRLAIGALVCFAIAVAFDDGIKPGDLALLVSYVGMVAATTWFYTDSQKQASR